MTPYIYRIYIYNINDVGDKWIVGSASSRGEAQRVRNRIVKKLANRLSDDYRISMLRYERLYC